MRERVVANRDAYRSNGKAYFAIAYFAGSETDPIAIKYD